MEEAVNPSLGVHIEEIDIDRTVDAEATNPSERDCIKETTKETRSETLVLHKSSRLAQK